MKCPSCGRDNVPTDQFCIFCNSPIQAPGSNGFWKALVAIAFPIVALSIIGTARVTAKDVYVYAWLAAASLCVIAFVAAIVFSGKGENRIAKGIWFGCAIGMVSLVASCSANFDVMF